MQECKVCEWNAEYVLLSILNGVRDVVGYYCRDCALGAISNSFKDDVYYSLANINIEGWE